MVVVLVKTHLSVHLRLNNIVHTQRQDWQDWYPAQIALSKPNPVVNNIILLDNTLYTKYPAMVPFGWGGCSTSIAQVYADSPHYPASQGLGYSVGGYPSNMALSSQLSQLRAQISAYQMIVRNEQIPSQTLIAASVEPVSGYTFPAPLVSSGPDPYHVQGFHHYQGVGFTMGGGQPVTILHNRGGVVYHYPGGPQLDVTSQVYAPSYPYEIYQDPSVCQDGSHDSILVPRQLQVPPMSQHINPNSIKAQGQLGSEISQVKRL